MTKIKLQPGRYYRCIQGHTYKRSNRAKRPYLPCGHPTQAEISEEQYLKTKQKIKATLLGTLEK